MLLSCMLCGSLRLHCIIVEITSKICYAPLCHDVMLVVYRQRKLCETFCKCCTIHEIGKILLCNNFALYGIH